jgi:hypothetical protein
MPAETQTHEKVTRLEDLEVKEVSVVDRGANKRTFLMVKNTGDAPMAPDAFEQAVADAQSGADLPVDDTELRDDGTPIEQADDTYAEDASEVTASADTDAVVEAQAERAAEDTELVVAMSDEVKAAYSETLKAMSDRLAVLSTSVAAAKTDDAADAHPAKLLNEIVSVSQALGRLAATDKAEAIAALAKGFPAEQHPVAMDLSQIEMTADGPMLKMPVEMALPMYCEMACKMLYQAEDALYGQDVSQACTLMMQAMKALGPFVPAGAAMSKAYVEAFEVFKQYAFNQPQPSIPAGVPHSQPPANMEKAGRKIAGGRLSRLEQALADLGVLVAELRPEAPAPEAEATPEGVSKAELAELLAVVQKQDAELRALRAKRPAGNAAAQGEHDESPKRRRVTWPDDLSAADEDPDLRF